jgi:hypothetical protein
MTGSRGSHGEGPTSRRATQADGILLATPKQQADPGDWRSRGQLEPATPSTSPSYWSDDDTEPGKLSVLRKLHRCSYGNDP